MWQGCKNNNLDFEHYIQAFNKHSEDKQAYENGETKHFYKKVDKVNFEH